MKTPRQHDLIVKALLARGETELPGLQGWRVFTRTVWRNTAGELLPVKDQSHRFYVRKAGYATRVGRFVTQSVSNSELTKKLLDEGRALCSAR